MKKITFILSMIIIFSGCARSGEKEVDMADIRQPAVAGSWYPGDQDSLRKMISEFMNSAQIEDDEISGRVLGIIAPHAGYIYSGPVAAYSFKTLMLNKEQYKHNTVILIGFAHRPSNWEGISIWSEGAWKTPLGQVAIDEKLAKKLIDYSPAIQDKREVHIGEHSLEMELPFLQYALGNDFKLVPISFSHQTDAEIDALVEALLSADINWEKTIIVVSTDMSHYRPYNDAVMIDRKTLGYVLAGNLEKLEGWITEGTGAFCGWAPVLTAMKVLPKVGANKTILLKYANSGDIQPSSASRGVVGYCAVAFVKSGKSNERNNNPDQQENSESNDTKENEYSLTEQQKLYLLKLARETIEKYIRANEKLEPEKPDDANLVEDAAVFVTIHREGMLRGCIGQMSAQEPLYLAVRDMAISAATKDPRFSPLSEQELDEIDIEVSVLSPLKRIDSWEKIEPFKHGVYVKRGWQSGVFLPQVWEQIPNKESFLTELCTQKARLEPDCYKNPETELYIYTVLKFSEKEMGLK